MQVTNLLSSQTGNSWISHPTEPEETPSPLVAFFLPNLTLGGAEQVTINVVNGLSARGYAVDLLLARYEGELHAQISDGVNVVELPPSRSSVFGVATHLPALVAYIRQQNPAVLFPQMAHVNVVCLALNRFLDVDTAIVPTQHSTFDADPSQTETPKARLIHKLVPHVYPSADRIISVSEGVAKSIIEKTSVDWADVSVIYNPVDTERVRERGRESVDHRWVQDDDLDVILFVGRLEPEKNLGTWLRAFAQIHDQNPDTRAIVAGDGSCRDEVRSEAARLDLDDVLYMPGYVENPYRYMTQASVFLLSSEYEGLPTVLIEALACGCHVVSTDCPSGPREILADGEYGHLVPVDDVDGLAGAVLEALEDPVPPERLRGRAEEFSTERVIEDYETVIQSCGK